MTDIEWFCLRCVRSHLTPEELEECRASRGSEHLTVFDFRRAIEWVKANPIVTTSADLLKMISSNNEHPATEAEE